MRGFSGVVVCTLAGCNWAFGLDATELSPTVDAQLRPDGDPRIDNDRDGVKDVIDDCIAADTDVLVDSDGGGIVNSADPCPFVRPATGNSDGDGIGDACDPFAGRGARVRCLMAFTDPELAGLVWRARGDAASVEPAVGGADAQRSLLGVVHQRADRVDGERRDHVAGGSSRRDVRGAERTGAGAAGLRAR